MRIGIIGAGQLGQMLGFAARGLEIDCLFVDPSESPPAASCDVIPYEFENVPVEALLRIEGKVPVYPPADALRHSQDRLDEKRLFDSLDIPLPGYRAIDTREDMDAAVDVLGLPVVIKTRRLGYDGKGQFVIREHDDIDEAWKKLGGNSLIAEQWVNFDYEGSCIGVRNVDGEVVIYPLSHNIHEGGILRTSRSPVDAPELADRAEAYVRRLLDRLNYVGVLALELFVCGDELLANEFAPRVHNSGHWTIEGSETSQFENHMRAVTNQPLGPTTSIGHAGMINLIGTIPMAIHSIRQGYFHDYGKAPRPGRKLGHITVTAETAADRDELIDIIGQSVI